MKFKLDENLPGEGVQILRAAGHDAVTAWGSSFIYLPSSQWDVAVLVAVA